MSLADAGLTFLSVFVAALLAFYLDGLRERRATARWVHEYLGFWRGLLGQSEDERAGNQALFGRIDGALAAWLAACETGHEPVWADIDAVNVNNAVSFTPILVGGGVSVVPPDLMRRMVLADATMPAMRGTAESAARLFETEVRPLVLQRVVALDPTQRRGVELYRVEFGRLRDLLDGYADGLAVILEDLDRHGF